MGGRTKSLFIAQASFERFIRQEPSVYFWTFTQPPALDGVALWDKDQAEEHFKPFRDWCLRNDVRMLVVWEQQKRGAWHPHVLVNKFIDVNWLRPWMVARGWGSIMYVIRVMNDSKMGGLGGRGPDGPTGGHRLTKYLTKYLTKQFRAETAQHAKCFGGSRSAKAGTTDFMWVPWEKAGGWLWQNGRDLYIRLWGKRPSFREMGFVIRLGVEETGWANIDPWWDFAFTRMNSS